MFNVVHHVREEGVRRRLAPTRELDAMPGTPPGVVEGCRYLPFAVGHAINAPARGRGPVPPGQEGGHTCRQPSDQLLLPQPHNE
jgi:hypothetical protein